MAMAMATLAPRVYPHFHVFNTSPCPKFVGHSPHFRHRHRYCRILVTASIEDSAKTQNSAKEAANSTVAASLAVLDNQDSEAPSSSSPSLIGADLAAIYEACQCWMWKGYRINYVVYGSGPPLLLVHGFGASIGHWRKNIRVLAKSNKVYAIDLLGLGGSEKPPKFQYTMESWAELLSDFIKAVIEEPTVLIGNSIGSLACLIVAAEAGKGDLVRGAVLLNCAGGMNNKAVVDDWRIRLLLPLLWLIDFLLLQPPIASWLFSRVQSRETLKNVLQSVYSNKDAVDDELVEVIRKPAQDPGALDAFVAIITGPPGPTPMSLMPKILVPLLLIWGDEDPFTPINGPVGKYFTNLVSLRPETQLFMLPDVGHCPHDDRPDLVHEKLLPWLATLPQ